MFELNNSYDICPCVKCVKIGCLLSSFILKEKQNRKCENVVAK